MSRLTDHVHGGKRTVQGSTFVGGGENGDGLPYGVMLDDGTVYPLEGQPPVATSKGWGNLAWMQQGDGNTPR